MSDPVYLGDYAIITLRVRNDQGVLTDPATIDLTITQPDATQIPKTKADFTSSSTGVWVYKHPTAQLDHHVWTATTTLPDGSTGGYFDVTNRATYTDVDDVRRVLAGSETLSGTAASLSDGDLASAISEAQTEVDTRLTANYQTPFTDPPQIVSTVTRDIAAYLATLTHRRGEPIAATEPIALRYARAQSLLIGLANGTIPLNVTDQEQPEINATAVANQYEGSLFAPADFQLGPATGPQPGTFPAPPLGTWW